MSTKLPLDLQLAVKAYEFQAYLADQFRSQLLGCGPPAPTGLMRTAVEASQRTAAAARRILDRRALIGEVK